MHNVESGEPEYQILVIIVVIIIIMLPLARKKSKLSASKGIRS